MTLGAARVGKHLPRAALEPLDERVKVDPHHAKPLRLAAQRRHGFAAE